MNIIKNKICSSGCKQDNGNKDDILCLLQQFYTIGRFFLIWFNVHVLSVGGLSRNYLETVEFNRLWKNNYSEYFNLLKRGEVSTSLSENKTFYYRLFGPRNIISAVNHLFIIV